jgi:hypothetical protein
MKMLKTSRLLKNLSKPAALKCNQLATMPDFAFYPDKYEVITYNNNLPYPNFLIFF